VRPRYDPGLVAPPRFVDPAHGDHHLQASSPAVDFAEAFSAADLDLDGLPREHDLAIKPDRFGARDAGAYERQQLQPVMRNGSFATDLRLWSYTAGVSAWNSDDAAGDPFSGSVRVLASGNSADLVALRQCVFLPGPGNWELNARGKAPGFGVTGRDRLFAKRADRIHGSEACNAGVVNWQGEMFVTSRNSWSAFSTSPAPIVVSVARWRCGLSQAHAGRVESSLPRFFGVPGRGRMRNTR
jgi:hypothetical protein